ncbi:MAG: amidohydrolase [Trueperella sp.]|nr:amidohydrolase [Trueperella sp.]
MSLVNLKANIEAFKDWQEKLYIHLHKTPELSMQETETLKRITEELTTIGYETVQVGGGVVGVLENGDGPKVLFRADFDGLPVKEDTGSEYASTVRQVDRDGVEQDVMHACGHDMHVATALGAAKILADNKDSWSGTYLALFQPGEETAEGAQAMVDDGIVDKIPKPDIALGQHVLTVPVAGKVGTTAGPVLSTAASMKITIHGKGSHGSMPHLGIDPVVIASSVVMRLQSIVAREISPFDFGVVTVGAFQSGSKANIIPASAELLLNIRAYEDDVREKMIASIKRITIGECEAAGTEKEPEFELFDRFPSTINDEEANTKVTESLKKYMGEDRVVPLDPITASEDFSNVPRAFDIPYVYFGLGGFLEGEPTYPNHNPKFMPALQPTLTTGTESAAAAALAYLGKED